MAILVSSFNEAKAHSSQAQKHVRDVIDNILSTTKAYDEIEPFLLPSGQRGSKQFDQAAAVDVLRKHDEKNQLDDFNLKDRILWDRLADVLRRSGFRVVRGRIVGLLEHEPNKSRAEADNTTSSQDEPDID